MPPSAPISTLTDPQKEWEFERARNPGTPPYAQWQDEKKAARAASRPIPRLPRSLSRTRRKFRQPCQYYSKLVALAKTAPGGQARAVAAKLAPIMSSLGMKVPEGISDAEALNSSIMRLLPLVRQPGSVSNYEQQSYINALPSLSLSVEGRARR